MDIRRWGFAGVTVATAAVAGMLTAGGVGSAASGAPRAARSHGVPEMPPVSTTRPPVKARAAAEDTSKIYLSIPGVKGEVVDGPYTDQIQEYAYSWGLSNASLGSGKPDLSDLNLQGAFDRSTPVLESMSETGQTTTATMNDLDSQNRRVRTMLLSGVRIDDVSVSSGDGGAAPSVALSLSYKQVASVYYYYGASGTTIDRSCWNIPNNATC